MAKTKNTVEPAEFAKALGCKENSILRRLKALDLAGCCTRCGGCGEYSYNMMHGTVCFGCSGLGVKMPSLTVELLALVVEAVGAGKLQPYLDRLAAAAEAKKMSDRILEDYAALVVKEKEDVAAAVAAGRFKRAHWTIGSDRGSWTLSAASEFHRVSQRLYMRGQCEKNAGFREAVLKGAVALHKAMIAESAGMVPVDASDEIYDVFTLPEEQSNARHAVSESIRKAAFVRVKEILAECGIGLDRKGSIVLL